MFIELDNSHNYMSVAFKLRLVENAYVQRQTKSKQYHISILY